MNVVDYEWLAARRLAILLIFQPVAHNKISRRPEEQCEQQKDAHELYEAGFLILVHILITVCCTIFGTVLDPDVSQQLVGIRVATVIKLVVVVALDLPAIKSEY